MFVICLFGGMFGAHKFVEKKYFMGILYLLTLGLFGVGWIIDLAKYASLHIPLYRTPTIYQIDALEGHEFEHVFADILRKNGFTNVRVTRGSGDQGIDVLAMKDKKSYAFQCKLYSGNVGNSAVQQVFTGAAHYGCNIPVVVTNRFFTKQASELARSTGVLLWDRNTLIRLLQKYKIQPLVQDAKQIDISANYAMSDEEIISQLMELNQEISTSYIQRKYRLPYTRAAEVKDRYLEHLK